MVAFLPLVFCFGHNEKEYMEVEVCDKSILEPLGFFKSRLTPGKPRAVRGVASNADTVLR